MTSLRKRKKDADSVGLSERELRLAEMLEEVLDHVRWLWILGYGNQYLVGQKLKVDKAERDRVLEAATRAVDRDKKLHEWRERLAQLKGEVVRAKRDIGRAKRELARERREDAAEDADVG
ncbi:MAG: hypothetical protein AAF628_19610 [Planctomycetota bacterium]